MENRELTSVSGVARITTVAAISLSSEACLAQGSFPGKSGEMLQYSVLIPALALVLLGAIALLFIVFVAARVKKSRKDIDIPDFSFDATETIRVDVNGFIKGLPDEDEGTVVLMPGFFRVTNGPEELRGQEFRITSVMTKIGREESSIDKSAGWIVLPRACATVSRYQADLTFEEGDYYVYHRSLTNETTVNGVPVTAKEPCKLANNDVISFGGIDVTFIRDGGGPARS